MLPLKDDVATHGVPVVTLALVAANVLVFLYQLSLGLSGDSGAPRAAEAFVLEFGAVPCRLTGACRTTVDFPPPAVTVLTSMFLHGGLLHVGGNMLYLWIFGRSVEDTLGHGRFLFFYAVSGGAAALAQTAMSPSSPVPMVGASGAVSGVLGAYLLLFPYARVLTLLTFGFFFRFVYVPAVIVLGFWIVVQFLNGMLAVTHAVAGHESAGGVAWFAHMGGFLTGMALLFVLRPRRGGRL